MREQIARRFDADPAYRVVHFLLGPERVVEWVHTIGVATDPSLAACVPPLPPVELRSITSEVEPVLFLFTGMHDLGTMLGLYREHAIAPPARPRVLDFGCGCGRMTRFIDPERWDACASEVNPDHVAWCREHLPQVDTRLNGWAPPLAFDDGTFDLIYSMSIFTHLSGPMLKAWMGELARVARPGAIVLLTFHGPTALRLIATSPPHQAFLEMSAAEAESTLARLADEGAIVRLYDPALTDRAKVGTVDYGTTFIDPAYFAHLGQDCLLEPLGNVEGGLRGFHDILVLRRRA